MIAVPEVGARKPVIIFIVVDLPAPFGPRKPNTSPRGTVNEMSSTAFSGPKYLTRCRISSIAVGPRAFVPTEATVDRDYGKTVSTWQLCAFARVCAPGATVPERRPDRRSRGAMTRG